MARPPLRGKFGGKVPRKEAVSHWGFVPIPGDKARRYVQISTGEVVSRRQAEKRAVGIFEKFAAHNRETRGGAESGMKQYWAKVKAFARKTGLTTREATQSAKFKKAYKASRVDLRETKRAGTKRARLTTISRLEALHDLDMIDDDTFEAYMAGYMGEGE